MKNLFSEQYICKQIQSISQENAMLFSEKSTLQYTCIPHYKNTADIQHIQAYIAQANRVSWLIYHNNHIEYAIAFISAICNTIHKTATISFFVTDTFQNMGVMSECLPHIHNYLFTQKDIYRIEAQVYQNNTASIKLLEKIGYEQEGLLRKNFMINNNLENSYMYSLLKNK